MVINVMFMRHSLPLPLSLFLSARLCRGPHRIGDERINTDADQFQLQNFKCANNKDTTAKQLSSLSGIERIEPTATGPN